MRNSTPENIAYANRLWNALFTMWHSKDTKEKAEASALLDEYYRSKDELK